MMSSQLRRAVVIALVLSTVSLYLNLPARAGGNALFNGRVVEADRVTPRSGVLVTLVDVATELTFPSKPTNEDGSFRIESAPAGTYGVLAKTAEGTYLASEELKLEEGANKPLLLALETGTQPSLVPGQTRGKLPPWAEGATAGALLLLGYLLIDDVSENTASDPIPF